jgi:hypothetical protein
VDLAGGFERSEHTRRFVMKREEPCACHEFALWYVDLAGVDDATADHMVCDCGHSTREHVASLGRCLGEVVVLA